MSLLEKKIGAEGDVKIEFKGGMLVLTGDYVGAGGGASLVMSLSSDYLLDALAKAIPGQIDDAVIALVKNAVKALP